MSRKYVYWIIVSWFSFIARLLICIMLYLIYDLTHLPSFFLPVYLPNLCLFLCAFSMSFYIWLVFFCVCVNIHFLNSFIFVCLLYWVDWWLFLVVVSSVYLFIDLGSALKGFTACRVRMVVLYCIGH